MGKGDERSKAWTENRIREGVPEICKSCGHHLPMFVTVIHKECAVFGTCDGVKNNTCGAWVKPAPLPVF